MSCSTGKSSFDSQELATEALIQNHIRFNHHSGQGPLNVYKCERCDQWHFTSRQPISEVLLDADTQARIRKEKQALEWEQKLRY